MMLVGSLNELSVKPDPSPNGASPQVAHYSSYSDVDLAEGAGKRYHMAEYEDQLGGS